MRLDENQEQLYAGLYMNPKPQRKCFTRKKRQLNDERVSVPFNANGTTQTAEAKRERRS